MSFYDLGDDASCVGKRARPLLFSDDGITKRLGKLKGSPLISVLVTSVEMIDLYTRAVSFLPLGLQCAVRDTVSGFLQLFGRGWGQASRAAVQSGESWGVVQRHCGPL